MRVFPLLFLPIALLIPRVAASQSIELYGAGGPTLVDVGYSVAAGVGFSFNPRLTILGSVEQTHLSATTTREGNTVSYFRGGTFLVGSAELRFFPMGRTRIRPYGLGGFAAGRSHPNVNSVFPSEGTNKAQGVFLGGGVLFPLGPRLSMFGDVRLLVLAERDDLGAAAPLRAGLAWRF